MIGDTRWARESHEVQIKFPGAKCAWCFNEALDLLRREPGVTSVDGSISGECMRVRHEGVAVERILAIVRTALRADTSTTAAVMVVVDIAGLHCSHDRTRTDHDV